jgi:hypothetical protein
LILASVVFAVGYFQQTSSVPGFNITSPPKRILGTCKSLDSTRPQRCSSHYHKMNLPQRSLSSLRIKPKKHLCGLYVLCG